MFTKRQDDLRRHPGEISFPGGRYEEGERDLSATALREAQEEIGLPTDAVEIVGALQPTPTIATGYAVYPFVGLIDPGQTWTPSAREVAEVLELPLDALLAGYGRRRLIRRGVPIRTDTYVVGDHLIWGATARILADLFDRIGPLLTSENSSAPASALLDRDVDEVPPLGPRPVVVLDVLLAEQLVKHEPGVRRALADPAVRDDRLARQHALAAVQIA